MSKNLERVSTFLRLLLNTTKDQGKALLFTLTEHQAIALCEIADNLLHLPLSSEAQKIVRKRVKLFKRLSDKKLSLKKKIISIENHQRQFLHTLSLVKIPLLKLLK